MPDERRIREVIDAAREDERTKLTDYESKQILSAWDVPITETRLAADKLEAVGMARELKYPVVMKIASPDILSKREVNGVKVGLSSEIEARHAFDDIVAEAKSQRPEAEIWGVFVQKYLPQEREVIVSTFRDPAFGPTILFGLGGVWVEVLEDVSFRLAPTSDKEAQEMMKEIRGYPILAGFGEEPAADMDALAEIIQKVSHLNVELEDISEIELNPIFAMNAGGGAVVVDARITLNGAEAEGGKTS